MKTIHTVDIAVTINHTHLVLIRRAKPPCMDKLCLPGGHIETTDASSAHAAAREALEEVNLHVAPEALAPLTTLDAIWRDERPGRWISDVFVINLPNADGLQAGDDARALVIRPIASLTKDEIGFDHWKAIALLTHGKRNS